MISYKDNDGHIHTYQYDHDAKVIDLSRECIAEIIDMSDLHNLRELNLNSNQITEIKGLDKLTNLRELYLAANQITYIRGLEKLSNLRRLDLCANPISEIVFLEWHPMHIDWVSTNLRILNLSSTNIKEIKGLY